MPVTKSVKICYSPSASLYCSPLPKNIPTDFTIPVNNVTQLTATACVSASFMTDIIMAVTPGAMPIMIARSKRLHHLGGGDSI
jgi:hypothetical protein